MSWPAYNGNVPVGTGTQYPYCEQCQANITNGITDGRGQPARQIYATRDACNHMGIRRPNGAQGYTPNPLTQQARHVADRDSSREAISARNNRDERTTSAVTGIVSYDRSHATGTDRMRQIPGSDSNRR